MRYYPIFIVFILLPSSIFSQEIDYKKNFIDESKIIKTFSEIKSSSFNYLKPLINKKPKKDKSSKGINSRVRIAAFIVKPPYTIQYLHSSGLGIAYNVISIDHIDEPESGGVGYSKKYVDMITPSYTFFFNNFSIGFGYSTKSGEKTKIWGCPSYDFCYDIDEVELSTIELKQFLISYDIFENYELITGISFLSYEYGRYDYSDENDLRKVDYVVDSKEINNKRHINIGFGYKF